jgi:hypothetical protein
VISLDHTQLYTTVCRTPLDEGWTRRRDLYLATQTLYKTNNHAPAGIRTHAPSKRSAADLRLRPRGHWDWPKLFIREGNATNVTKVKQQLAILEVPYFIKKDGGRRKM